MADDRSLTDTDLQAIADVVTTQLNKVPLELKDVLHKQVWMMPLPTTTPQNYVNVRCEATEDGLWLVFEVNNYRLWEHKFAYSDEYRFPKQ